MREHIENILKDIPPRNIYIAMGATIFFIMLASYLYLFKKPLKEYANLKQTKVLLQAKMENKNIFSNRIKDIKIEVDKLNKRLHGENPIQHEEELFAHRIHKLDSISSRHDIGLLSIKPDIPRDLPMFKEISFDVEVAGGYIQIYEWLHEVEQRFGSVVVKRFEIEPIVDTKDLLIRMKMVSYKPS